MSFGIGQIERRPSCPAGLCLFAATMLLRETLEQSGQRLFRWRSYLPLVLLNFLSIAFRGYERPHGSPKVDGVWELCCFGVSGFGLFLRDITVGHAPKGTSGRNMRNQRADELNTTGMYSIVRNPLYLGNYFMYLGLCGMLAMFALVLLGPFTRLATLPLLTIVAVAIYTTKIPILLKSGFWNMAHETRTDFSMVLGALFLLIVGAGAWSLDAFLHRPLAQRDGIKT